MERRRSVQEYVGRDVEKDLFRPFRTVNGSSPVLLLTKKTRPAKICQELRRLNKGIIENILLYYTFLPDGSFQHVSGAITRRPAMSSSPLRRIEPTPERVQGVN